MAFPLIKSKRDFEIIYKKGKNYGGAFFSLLVLSEKRDIPSRFGIVISTKVSKKAVERNRKRRQIKEIIYLNRDKIARGYLAIVVLKDKGLELSYKELEKELTRILEKAGLMA